MNTTKSLLCLALATVMLLAWPSSRPCATASESANPNPVTGETPAQRDARMKWWREARLGMFVHWGLYSAAAGSWGGTNYSFINGKTNIAEWIQNTACVPADEYAARLRPLFKPRPGFAKAWARLAKDMGAKYVIFTSKHHEGFALWDSKVTDFDARDFTGRDLFKEIVTALREEGLHVGIYFSVIDWHSPDFPVDTSKSGLPHPLSKRLSAQQLAALDAGRDMNRYVDFMHKQVKEVVSNYGPIDVVWWDWSSKETQGESWRAAELMATVRRYQPKVIMNNRLYYSPNVSGDNLIIFDVTKGDFTTPEQHLPATGMPGVDWESCMTLNDTWGYSKYDFNWKSTETLVHNTVDAASKGGNYLINAGPMADGTIPEAIQIRFRELGAWMKKYGESVYATTANPVGDVTWGRITAKPGKLYLHVFDWPKDNRIPVPVKSAGDVKAWMLADERHEPLAIETAADRLTIVLNPGFQNPYDSVVVLETNVASVK
jgi:alpha-L-fucosidase